MGMPSIGIYSYELYKEYQVEDIIRIGSAGSYDAELEIFDVVLAESAWSESSYGKTQNGDISEFRYPSIFLNEKLKATAELKKINLKVEKIHSSDVFYRENNVDNYLAFRKKHDVKCVEMESFALFHNAQVLNKSAACLLTISDSFVSLKETTAKERQDSFTNMIEIALEVNL